MIRHFFGPVVLRGTGVLGLISAAVATAWFVVPHPLLIYNASASVPDGFYIVHAKAPIHVGDIVALHTPPAVRHLADARHYLPKTVPMLKIVAALAGDEICAHDKTIFINGKWAARRLGRDSAGRIMPTWEGCKRLASADVFFLNEKAPLSFDGRYFGVSNTGLIIGRVTPL